MSSIFLSLLFVFNSKAYIIKADNAVEIAEEAGLAQQLFWEHSTNNISKSDANNSIDNTVEKYITDVNNGSMTKKASIQAKEVSKNPNVMENKSMTDYTMSSSNPCWVPYWYWFTIMNSHSLSSMPKKYPANVKTSNKNVRKYQNYVNNKAKVFEKNCITAVFVGLGVLIIAAKCIAWRD